MEQDYSLDLVVIGIPGRGAAIKRHTRARRKCEGALCTIHTMRLCESTSGCAFRLTGFCPNRALAGHGRRVFSKIVRKVLGRPEPYRHLDIPSKGAACVRAVILAIDQTKMRKINAIR